MCKEKVVTLLKVLVGIALLWELYGPHINHELLLLFVFPCTVYFTFNSLQCKRHVWAIIFILTSFIYNPIAPVSLNNNVWILTNTSTSIFLFSNIFMWYFLSYKVASLYNKGNFIKAEDIAIKSFYLAKDTFGFNNSITFASLGDLVDVYLIQCKYNNAINLLEYAIGSLTILGNREYVDKLTSTLNTIREYAPTEAKHLLGNNEKKKQVARQYDSDKELEYLFGRDRNALDFKERNHINRARTLVNTALSYGMQHRYDEAEKLMEYAVSICEETSDETISSENSKNEDNLQAVSVSNDAIEEHIPFYWPPKKCQVNVSDKSFTSKTFVKR